MLERGEQSVKLMWSPPPSDDIKPVEEYLLELTYEERGTITETRVCNNRWVTLSLALITISLSLFVSQSIQKQQTTHTADDLVPGVTYTLVLRSSNLAGESTPTPPLTHTTTSSGENSSSFSLSHTSISFSSPPPHSSSTGVF